MDAATFASSQASGTWGRAAISFMDGSVGVRVNPAFGEEL
jgi:hypothetical protein